MIEAKDDRRLVAGAIYIARLEAGPRVSLAVGAPHVILMHAEADELRRVLEATGEEEFASAAAIPASAKWWDFGHGIFEAEVCVGGNAEALRPDDAAEVAAWLDQGWGADNGGPEAMRLSDGSLEVWAGDAAAMWRLLPKGASDPARLSPDEADMLEALLSPPAQSGSFAGGGLAARWDGCGVLFEANGAARWFDISTAECMSRWLGRTRPAPPPASGDGLDGARRRLDDNLRGVFG